MKLKIPTSVKRAQSAIILAVFVVFVSNALGLTDFSFLMGGKVALNSQVLLDLFDGRIAEPLLQIDFLVFVAVGGTLALLLPSLTPIAASLLTLGAMVPPFYIAWAFPYPPPVVPLEYTLLSILILFSVNVLSSYFAETHERQKIISVFGQYVPPTVVDSISTQPDLLSMAGETRDMSVLFCDVKDFSSISERLDAVELTRMMNHYLTAMTDVLHEHGATIDKYIGDAIMAFWGAPVEQPDHARRAVAASLAMQARARALREEFAATAWPELEIGVGVSSGAMNVGNMGSRYRVAYTVLGDEVNVASRIEALTRLYGVDVLVTNNARQAAGEFAFREIDHVRVKGRGGSTRIFTPLPAAPDAASDAATRTALDAYYGGDWDSARTAFRALADDAQTQAWAEVMLNKMANDEPPQDWDGVTSFGSTLSYTLEPPPSD